MGLYENIRDIAKSKGYSVNKLELELGFARSSINKFNKNRPSVEKLQQIADLLDVSVDYLMTGKEEPEKNKNPYSNLKGIYLSYAKEAQDSGIDPDDIRLALDTIRRLRGEK
ncbi:helix-turn-helix transcriptional regulator [Clostridium sp. FS41]|uniref:helix-turn-helix domain-containing protein n=1 Tax=Clostridium sp. FS41 TaxID=1609975 RepID=UPI00061F713C|nr:helix-turn-helix transcriptional regulator [Clostridium sp. FS41]KJJ69355.1 HTH-type transcriptional regulator SinR [Clostridium sp. FS41]